MTGIWLIGLAFPAALCAGICYAFARRHPQRQAIGVGATAAILFWLIGWSVARSVASATPDRSFEIVFIQLALSTIACFVFAVVTMVAARFR